MATGAESQVRDLAPELDNIRAALVYCRRVDAEAGLRLAGAAREVWFAYGQGEGRHWLSEFLDIARQPTAFRARALCTAGILATGQQADEALTLLAEGHRLFVELGDESGRAWAAQNMGEALLVLRLDADTARRCLEEALAGHEALGNRFGVERAIGGLGLCAAQRGDYNTARQRLQQAREMAVALRDVFGEAFALTFLGWVAMSQGDSSAVEHLRGAVRVLSDGREPMLLATAVEGYAGLMMAKEPGNALRLAAAGTAIRDRIGNLPARPAVELVSSIRSRSAKALGVDTSEREWHRGLGMSVEETAAAILTGTTATGIAGAPQGLTRRELEISRLVAQGLTSREIATRLFLSERTVENHVEHVLNKLDLRNRAQIAAWVVTELSTSD